MRNAISKVTEVRLAQYVMGTVVEVVVTPICSEEHAHDAAASALHEFERIEGLFSRFDPWSELSRVNRNAAHQPIVVSDEFFALTARGLQYSRHSAGAFSITLQPLISLWERASEEGRTPRQKEIDSALSLCTPDSVILDATRRTIRFARPGVSLNFDGLAKGYATDVARAVLEERGFTRALINAGSSSLACLYPESARSLCRVLIRHPGDPRRCVAQLVIDSRALSTSGTGEREFKIWGRRFSHVIDPSSGWPIEGLASATGLGEYAELLEVASKVLLLRGCEKGERVFARLGWTVDAVALKQTADDELRIRHSSNLSIDIGPEYDADSTCVH